MTDITRYDTNDTSQLVWFTVPKATGKPVWLPPYITDNLGARVIDIGRPDVAWGMAVYDPEKDDSVEDVIVRADILMHANKRERKEGIR